MGEITNLSLDQISSIVNSIPQSKTAYDKIGEEILRNIRNKLYLDLRTARVRPEKIPDLADEILSKYLRALQQPGTPVGINTAETLSAPVTQAILNSFKQAGTEKGSVNTLTEINELISMSTAKERSDPYIYVHFKDKDLIFGEIYNYSSKLVGISVRSLVEEEKALSVDDGEGDEYWVKMYCEINGIENPRKKNKFFYRMKFDVSKLFENKIQTSDIVRAINAHAAQSTFVGNVYYCIPSPTNFGIVDLYPDLDVVGSYDIISEIFEVLGDNKEKKIFDIFIENIFKPNMEKIILSGIQGNLYVYPRSVKTLDMVYSTEKLFSDPSLSFVRIDGVKARVNSFPLQKVKELALLSGVEVIFALGEYLSDVSDEVRREIEMDPMKGTMLVVKDVDDFVSLVSSKIPSKENDPLFDINNPGPIYRKANYFYADVRTSGVEQGNAFRSVMTLDFVDNSSTYCNSFIEMNKCLGIEAVRLFIIRNYIKVFSDSYTSPVYVVNQANIQTSIGSIVAVSAHGAARLSMGTISRASFQEAFKSFVNAAVYGKREDTRSTATNIFLGKKIHLGTGYVKTAPNVLFRREMVESLANPQLREDLIEQLNDVAEVDAIGYGADQILSEDTTIDNQGIPPFYRPPAPMMKSFPLPAFVSLLIGKRIPLPGRASSAVRNFDPTSLLDFLGK